MIIWIIGMPGSGKTSIGSDLFHQLKKTHSNCVFIDGDDVRNIMMNDLGHSIDDRKINANRIRNLWKHLDSQNINVICSILSLFEEDRAWNRANYQEYFEVYLEVPIEIIKTRDQKGLYSLKTPKNVVGQDIKFYPPENPDLIIKSYENHTTIPKATELILRHIKHRLNA